MTSTLKLPDAVERDILRLDTGAQAPAPRLERSLKTAHKRDGRSSEKAIA